MKIKDSHSILYILSEKDSIEVWKTKHDYFEMNGRFSGRWKFENDSFKSLTLEEIRTSSR